MSRKTRESSGKDRPLIEELEPRVLLSADLPGVPVDVSAPAANDVPVTVATTHESVAVDDATAPERDGAHVARREIVFVDAGVENHESLVADLTGRSGGGREIAVFVLDADRDGISQIGEILSSYAFDVDAVHVLSHGTDSGLQLGDTWLSGQSLSANADAITGWRNALTENADLLLYGCNLAAARRSRPGGRAGQPDRRRRRREHRPHRRRRAGW